VEVPAEEVARALAGRGLFSGAVTNVRVTRRGVGGFATEVEVTGPGKRARLGAYAFRLAVGAYRLQSTNFEVTPTATGFLFQGCGFGHGVGLCQWGAQGMAQAGWNYREILLHYYPGSRLVRVYR
jgi:stage II sporulation protein D